MNVRPLRAFRAVVRSGSTTRAAAELGVSQPAVSSIVSSLERELGFDLFLRRKGRLNLTAEGEYFARQVEITLDNFDRLAQTARDIKELRLGELRVACLPGLSATLMPKVIAEFLEGRPRLRVFLETCPSSVIEDQIRSEQFDVGLAERTLSDTDISGNTISMRCVCIVPIDHRLAEKKQIGPKDLADEPFVSLKPDHFTYFHLENAFIENEANWNVQVITRLFTTACGLVSESENLVSVVDPISASQWHKKNLRIIPFVPEIPFHIKIMYPQNRTSSMLAKELIDMLHQRVDSLSTGAKV